MPRSRSLALLFGAVLVIQACTTAASPTPPASAPASAQASASSSAAGAVELTVLEHQDLRVKAMKAIIPGFEAAMKAAGKNVTVNLVDANVANDDEFKQKVTVQFQGDAPADVTSYPGSWVPDFSTAGYLLDLSDRLAAWSDWSAHFYPILRDRTVQADGKSYSVPRGGTVMEYFVRKDVLDTNGVATTQPNSWDELVTRLNDLHTKTNLPAITVPAGKQWGGGTFDEGFRLVFLGTGGNLYDTATSKWIVSSQALKDTFGFYANLQKGGLLPTKALLDPNPWEPTKYDGFTGTLKDGTAVPVSPPVTTQGSWGWIYDWGPTGARPIPDLTSKVITWAFPSKEANKNYVFASEDWSWTISAKSAHPDEAWAFVQYMNTGQALADDISAVGNLAPRDDISTLAPYSTFPYLIEMEKLLPTGKTFQPPVGTDKIQQAVGDATEQILLNKMDGDQAAAYFATQATDLLGADAVESQ
jgi:multiple sugar transport system substrate-binding protein